MTLGWEWDHVEETVTLDRLRALRRYLRNFPPVHILVQKLALGLGVHKHETAEAQRGTLEDLRSMFPQGNI